MRTLRALEHVGHEICRTRGQVRHQAHEERKQVGHERT